MQAVVFHEHGGPEVLRVEDMPQPTPGPGEVLLRVRAIAVNRTLDCEVRSRPGAYGSIPMSHISGAGPTGEVAQVGEGVQACQPGDRVVGFPDPRGEQHPWAVSLPKPGSNNRLQPTAYSVRCAPA